MARFFSSMAAVSSALENSSPTWDLLPLLQNVDLHTFRKQALHSRRPAVVSPFHLPAAETWILPSNPPSLNLSHLAQYADNTLLPMELTSPTPPLFQRVPAAPLSLFLAYASLPRNERADRRFYIAQAPIDALPTSLRSDFPTPTLVREAGTGDIYGTSLWMGLGGSSTPLHRDPNPNLLVQVTGRKAVRLLDEAEGSEILGAIRRRVASSEGAGERFRGEAMMREERMELDQAIWESGEIHARGWEALLEPRDGLFIPNGWWHAIRSVGEGLNISVNWWFR